MLVFYVVALLCNAFDPTVHKVPDSIQPTKKERTNNRCQVFYTAGFWDHSSVQISAAEEKQGWLELTI
jgi:hypothetical protein